jgi:hypothetical protein
MKKEIQRPYLRESSSMPINPQDDKDAVITKTWLSTTNQGGVVREENYWTGEVVSQYIIWYDKDNGKHTFHLRDDVSVSEAEEFFYEKLNK